MTTPCTRSNFLNPLNQAIYRKTTPLREGRHLPLPINMSDGRRRPLRESPKKAPLRVRCRCNVGRTMAAGRGSIYNYFIKLMNAKFQWTGSGARQHVCFYTMLIATSVFANTFKDSLIGPAVLDEKASAQLVEWQEHFTEAEDALGSLD